MFGSKVVSPSNLAQQYCASHNWYWSSLIMAFLPHPPNYPSFLPSFDPSIQPSFIPFFLIFHIHLTFCVCFFSLYFDNLVCSMPKFQKQLQANDAFVIRLKEMLRIDKNTMVMLELNLVTIVALVSSLS